LHIALAIFPLVFAAGLIIYLFLFFHLFCDIFPLWSTEILTGFFPTGSIFFLNKYFVLQEGNAQTALMFKYGLLISWL